jgi:hypothetical protein
MRQASGSLNRWGNTNQDSEMTLKPSQIRFNLNNSRDSSYSKDILELNEDLEVSDEEVNEKLKNMSKKARERYEKNMKIMKKVRQKREIKS